MRVRIDAARHYVAPRRVEDMVGGVVEIGADGDDLVMLHEDVGLLGQIGGDDGAAFDEFGHYETTPRCITADRWRARSRTR